ncbi:MAG: global cell cycle regulator GcrA-like protein [Alphaproteobacteria bacterium]|nr:global cell cycle regulator GcrA-like protein [Alphaproteobacteria bacterium]
MAWTDEMVEELSLLWQEGLTTGEIGKKLGVSKNAVVGKAHRLGLEGRPSPIKRTAGDGKKVKKEKKKIGIVDLHSRACRWPIGDPRDDDFHFCDKEAIPGKPYCLEHCEEAYVKIARGGKNAAKVRARAKQESVLQEGKKEPASEG